MRTPRFLRIDAWPSDRLGERHGYRENEHKQRYHTDHSTSPSESHEPTSALHDGRIR
jgi:hypothetical protein